MLRVRKFCEDENCKAISCGWKNSGYFMPVSRERFHCHYVKHYVTLRTDFISLVEETIIKGELIEEDNT